MLLFSEAEIPAVSKSFSHYHKHAKPRGRDVFQLFHINADARDLSLYLSVLIERQQTGSCDSIKTACE